MEMAELHFETLTFRITNNGLVVTLLNICNTRIPIEEVENIAPFTISNVHTIIFDKINEEKATTKFSFLLTKYFDSLKNSLTGNKVTYVHRNSGIPLIGNVAFGIVYRGSSIIEIKPVTSCNLDCIYCSISEGLSSTKNDFIIEKEYLVEELKKLLKFIDKTVEIHIGVQGEPFLYSDMENLIEDLQAMKDVHTISVDTNGTLLNKDKIDRLAKNNKLQINLSLDAIDEDLAKRIAGVKTYNVKQVKEIISYASQKLKVIVAPVIVQEFNQEELEKIIKFVKSLPVQPILGIQNFLRYKTGRNPGKEMSWEKFYSLLEELEQKHQIKLKLQKEDFNIIETKPLPKPFVEGDVINAVIKCPDRFHNSVIAVSKDRTISVPNCSFKKDKKISVKIVRDKHNVFVGKLV